MFKDFDRVLVSREELKNKINELAREMDEIYKDSNPLFICI